VRSSVDLAGPSSNDLLAGAGARQPRARRGDRAGDRTRDDRRGARAVGAVARKQPHRYGRFAARWLCLYLEEHEKATLGAAPLTSYLPISQPRVR
jgi:hypothetical protein